MPVAMRRSTALLCAAVTLLSCASGAPVVRQQLARSDSDWQQWPEAQPGVAKSVVGARLAARAAELVGLDGIKSVTTAVPDDCSGFVRYLYGMEGLDLM